MEQVQELDRVAVRRAYRVRPLLVITLTVVSTFVAARTTDASGVPPVVATVVTFPGIAREFDYDSGRAAWIDSGWALRIRVGRTGAGLKLLYTNPYEEIPDHSGRRRLFLEQRRLVWLSRRGRGISTEADHIYLGGVTPLRGHRVSTAAHNSEGSYVLGLGSDASGFSYGFAEVEPIDPDLSRFRVVGGGVFSIVDGRRRRVPGAPAAIVLGRAAGRVAIAPVDMSDRRGGVPVAAGPVEIRDATTGALVSSFSPGRVRAFALSPRIAAVLTRRKIDRYDVTTGKLLGSTEVPADVADDLDIEGTRIVFRRMRSIRLLDTATGKVATVATTQWRPTAVRIDGGTVAWVEQRRIAVGEVSKKTFRARIRIIALR